MKEKIIFFIAFLQLSVLAQIHFTEKDKEICAAKFKTALEKNLSDKTIDSIIIEIGKGFIGVDYEACSLEKCDSIPSGEENLVVHLSGLDCTTFVENTLAISRCIKSRKTSFEDFQKELTAIRYRGGKIEKYPSRLHYFSDWIYDNSRKKIVEDITKSIGGVVCPNKVGFMTKNRNKYKQISKDDALHEIIKNQEKEINAREFYYIPKNDVRKAEEKINSGCIIAITSGVEGLDITHVGIAIKMNDGRIHLLHAPSVGSKVHISEKPLYEYMAKNKKQTGIVIIKPLEP